MPAINITDLNNAKADVDHIAEIATSPALTATDRLTNTKKTIAGVNADADARLAANDARELAAFNTRNSTEASAFTGRNSLETTTFNTRNSTAAAQVIAIQAAADAVITNIAGITNRGAWAPATLYAGKDIVLNASTWYICVVAHTSSAAFATDTASKWRVYQGVNAADLASPTGWVIGRIRSALNAIASTLEAWLNWQSPSIFEYMTPAEVADVLAGTLTIDVTTKIQRALDGATAIGAKTVTMRGNALFTNLTIPVGVTFRGDGNRAVKALGIDGAPSSLVRTATATGPGVTLAGMRSKLQNIGVFANPGAVGDGIWIASNGCQLENVTSNGHTGRGIRIGATSAGYLNCNSWRLTCITAAFNIQEGILISDDFSVFPLNDANAGILTQAELRSNGGDGLKCDSGFANMYSAVLADRNSGWGVHFTNRATKNTLISGDPDEANTLGSVRNEGQYNTFIGISSDNFSDAGTYTNLLGYTINKLNQTTFANLATVTATSATVANALVLENKGNAANGRGVAVAFGVPNGTGVTPRIGATIAGKNSASSLADYLDFSCNDNGTLTSKVWIHPAPTLNMMGPSADNSLNLGQTTFRWSNTYSANFRPGAGTAIWTSGAGTPQGAITSPVGGLYTNSTGAAGTTLYIKETGTGNTGWVAARTAAAAAQTDSVATTVAGVVVDLNALMAKLRTAGLML